jgi:membrane-bound lytic murein transglycosylase B
MKIPQGQKVDFRLHGCAPAVKVKDLPGAEKEKNGIENTFDLLLNDVFGQVQEKGNLPFQAAPLDYDRLQYLVQTIQGAMNNSLFNAVLDEGKDNPNVGFGEALNGLLEAYLSQIQQAGEKTGHAQQTPDVEQIIAYASKTYGVDQKLIKAVIKAESDFDSNCTSPKGAKGLMQLMPETARDLGVQNACDPVENIMGGTRYLKSLLDRYEGNIPVALSAYNWGMGNVERHPGRLPQETRVYISRVNQCYREGTS